MENLRFELLENGKRTSFAYHNGELLHEEGGDEKQTSYHLGAWEFSDSNQTLMLTGRAPYAPESLQTGDNYNQEKYNVHHLKPVEDGGDVYNIDNLGIVAPKTHDEIHAEIDEQKRSKINKNLVKKEINEKVKRKER